MSNKQELLANEEGILVLDNASKIIVEILKLGDPENLDAHDITISAEALFDIVELLLLYAEQYEGLEMEKMIDIENENSLHYINYRKH